jgi:hypothetical protein
VDLIEEGKEQDYDKEKYVIMSISNESAIVKFEIHLFIVA